MFEEEESIYLRTFGGGHNFVVDGAVALSLHPLKGQYGAHWGDSTGKKWWTAYPVRGDRLPERDETDEEALSVEEAGILAVFEIKTEHHNAALFKVGDAYISVNTSPSITPFADFYVPGLWSGKVSRTLLCAEHNGRWVTVFTDTSADKIQGPSTTEIIRDEAETKAGIADDMVMT